MIITIALAGFLLTSQAHSASRTVEMGVKTKGVDTEESEFSPLAMKVSAKCVSSIYNKETGKLECDPKSVVCTSGTYEFTITDQYGNVTTTECTLDCTGVKPDVNNVCDCPVDECHAP